MDGGRNAPNDIARDKKGVIWREKRVTIMDTSIAGIRHFRPAIRPPHCNPAAFPRKKPPPYKTGAACDHHAYA